MMSPLVANSKAGPRAALLADFREEGWPSMDLVVDMLAAALPAAAEAEAVQAGAPPFQVRLVCPPLRPRFSRLPGARAGRLRSAAWTFDRLANRFYDYPRFARRELAGKFDLFHVVDHSYSQLVHELPPGRTVVTCHDLDTFRCLWEPAGGGRGRLFRAMTRRILTGMQRAAHVCCDSEATRGEILRRDLLPPERTSVVRLGLRPELTAPLDPAAVARIDQLLGPPAAGRVDILHVGSTIARKRIDVLLEVFARVKERVGLQARLLRVGGAFTGSQRALAAGLGLGERDMVVLPFLSAAELAAVYHRARVVLVPSEAEGFGLPVIEALACGTPVVASDLPVLREVGGEAASYAPVAGIEAWAAQVAALLEESERAPLAWERRRGRCRLQAGRFSWEETARQTLEIYRRVLAL